MGRSPATSWLPAIFQLEPPLAIAEGLWPPQFWTVTLPAASAVDVQKSAPSKTIGAPSKTIGAPSKTIGAPSKTIGAPSKTIGAPSKTIGAPSKTIGAPSKTIGAPSKTMGGRFWTATLLAAYAVDV